MLQNTVNVFWCVFRLYSLQLFFPETTALVPESSSERKKWPLDCNLLLLNFACQRQTCDAFLHLFDN